MRSNYYLPLRIVQPRLGSNKIPIEHSLGCVPALLKSDKLRDNIFE